MQLSYAYELSFPVIGEQYYAFAFSRAGFRAEIAPARTFGFLKELETLNKMNLAKGASLLNTLALDESGVVNVSASALPTNSCATRSWTPSATWRWPGAPLIARFEGSKSGHATNNALLRELFSDPSHYEPVELEALKTDTFLNRGRHCI